MASKRKIIDKNGSKSPSYLNLFNYSFKVVLNNRRRKYLDDGKNVFCKNLH